MDENPYKAPSNQAYAVNRNSPLGIASFALGCLAAAIFLASPWIRELPDPIGSIIGIIFFLGCLLSILLGIAGLVQKGRKRSMAAIGLAMSLILVCIALAAYSEPRGIGGPVEIRLRR